MRFKINDKEIEFREICFDDIENYYEDIKKMDKGSTILDIKKLNLKYISLLSNDVLSIEDIKKIPSSQLRQLLEYLQCELNLEDTKKKLNYMSGTA